MALGIAACTTEYVRHSSFIGSEVVSVGLELSSDLELPALECWIFPIGEDRRSGIFADFDRPAGGVGESSLVRH